MKLVVVKWLDSTSFNYWTTKEGTQKAGLELCYSSGFLVEDGDEFLTIAVITTKDKKNYSTWVNIPKGCVKAMEIIREVDWNEDD